jgi:hypothetical protein
MAQLHNNIKLLRGQHGGVAIWFALLLPVLLGFTALAVDLAHLNLTKVELQNAADAAALGGALSLSDPSTVASDKPYNWTAATTAALNMARSNFANASQIQDALIEKGFWNLQNPSLGLRPPNTPGVPVAGDVPATRATIAIDSDQNNGPLKLFFAPILGIAQSNIQASAIAILNGAGGPFDYAIFSGSTSVNLIINGSGFNIKGSVHSNDNLLINGSSITITGAAEANGTVTTNGSGLSIGSKSSNAGCISMPDYSASIAEAAAAAHQTYTGSKIINGSSITLNPIYVQGSPGSITVNGSAFTATGTVMADGDIIVNGSGIASSNSQVCFYSKNGNITVNGSNFALNGVLYAPNGRIIINGSSIKVNGSIVGNQVLINGSSFTVDRTGYPITSLPGSHVQLVE